MKQFHKYRVTVLFNYCACQYSMAWWVTGWMGYINLLKPTGYVMHQQFNIQQLYALTTLYLCVLYLSENKRQLVPLTS